MKINRKTAYREVYGYAVVFGVYLLLHLFMHTDYWDDVRMTTVLAEHQYDLWSLACYQYENWTSRVLLMCMEAVVGAMPPLVWKLLDSVMIVLLFYSVSKIVEYLSEGTGRAEEKKMLLMLCMCFPYALFATAGWLVTTIGYTWSFACAAYSLYRFMSAARGGKTAWWQHLLFVLALLYAGNYEVICVVLLLSMALIWWFCDEKRKLWLISLEAAAISAVNLLLFILAPGNQMRMTQDAWYHDTAELLELSVGGQLRMGINSAFYHFISVPNVTLFLFCMILFFASLHHYGRCRGRVLAAGLPLLIDAVWTGYLFLFYTCKNRTLTYIYPDASFTIVSRTEQYLALGSAVLMVLAMLYTICDLAESVREAVTMSFILLVPGLAPEVALGFTTTVTASIIRVSGFFYFAMIVCMGVLLRRQRILENRAMRLSVCVTALTGSVLNVMQIIRHIMVYG